MNKRHLFISIQVFVCMMLLAVGCDNQITQTADETEIELTQAPITYVSNSGSFDTESFKEVVNDAPYYCLVSSLNASDDEWAYNKERFDVSIPKGLVKQAQKEGLDNKWVTFRFADKDALSRENADPLGGGGLVRMARCRLPATPKIINHIQKQLTKFKEDSWIHTRDH